MEELLTLVENSAALPPRCYFRGDRIWIRYKLEGRWVNRSTPFRRGEDALCTAYVAKLLQGAATPLTLSRYAATWLDKRKDRGVAAVVDERPRLAHILLLTGDVPLIDLRRQHIRDAIRALLTSSGLAPRTVLHSFWTLHNCLEEAVEDGVIDANPAQLRKGDLPADIDADPEWRALAMFETDEVVTLIASSRIPPWRRVTYALKALAGLRHGEAAALQWRDYNADSLRVAHALDSRTGEIKETKTRRPRRVPVHPELARVLLQWKLAYWRTYGRRPEAEGLVVPVPGDRETSSTAISSPTTCSSRAQTAGAATRWFCEDLNALGLRVDAGETRNRGGHDLRAWFKTATIECGADSLIVRRVTNAPPKDVNAGYERFSFSALAREVGKLKIALPAELFAAGAGANEEALKKARL